MTKTAILAVALLFTAAALAGCGSPPTPNRAPVAKFKVTGGATAGTYVLDARGSSDPDGDPFTVSWDWVVGNATGLVANVTLPADLGNGTLPVIVVVRDTHGAFSAGLDKAAIVSGSGLNQNPSINIVDAVRWVKTGASIKLDATPTTDPDGDALTYNWIWGTYQDFDPTLFDNADPLKNPNRTLQVFNSALLNPGQAFSLAFDKVGTYNFVCHPHPWMKGRLVVDPAMAASNANVEMVAYQFTNRTLHVGLGSTVNFVNHDHDQHTASATDFVPGTQDGGSGTTFSPTLSDGKYVVRLVAKDAKGGTTSASYGLRVSSDAPVAVIDKHYESTPQTIPAQTQAPIALSPPFYLNYSATITATLEWTDPSGQAVVGNLSLTEVGSGATTCPANRVQGQTKVIMACKIIPSGPNKSYKPVVFAQTGVLAQWTLSVQGTEYLSPGFGDYNAARCHIHPGQPPHCF